MAKQQAEKDRIAELKAAAEAEQVRRLAMLPTHPGWSLLVAKLEEEIVRATERRDADRTRLTNGPQSVDGPHWDLIARLSYVSSETRLTVLKDVREFVTKSNI
jgi:hypothetical protein